MNRLVDRLGERVKRMSDAPVPCLLSYAAMRWALTPATASIVMKEWGGLGQEAPRAVRRGRSQALERRLVRSAESVVAVATMHCIRRRYRHSL